MQTAQATIPVDDDYRYRRPWMYAKQEQAFFCSERYAICEASTKSGKTVACMCWLAEEAMRAAVPGRNYWWVAPIYGQAKIAFRRLKAGLPRHFYHVNESEMTLTLANGSIIWFKGADKTDSLFGEDVYAAVIDEASRCKEDAWYAVRSTLTQTRGPIRIIGNVKGRRNWAYLLARKAESGQPGYRYTKITALDAVEAGVLDAAEIESARADLPDAVFRELYLAEPSDDGGNPFGLAAIAAQVAPLSNAAPVAWGIDLAKSVDWTVCIALDAVGAVCRFGRWQGPWEATIPRILDTVGRVPALVDSTGVGDPILEKLQAMRPGVFEGYKYSSTSKQQLMEGLAVAIQQHEITYPPGVIVTELEAFEYEYTRTGVRYCIIPSMRILTSDLRWVQASDIEVGTNILAFDEEPLPDSKSRRWRSAVVTHAEQIIQPCYRVTLEDGTVVTSSAEHLWLVDTGQGAFQWRRTDQLRAPHPTSRSVRYAPSRIVRLLDAWDEPQSYAEGYLAAVFDAEGHISQHPKTHGGHSTRLGFAQRDNALAEQARTYLHDLGFSWAEHTGNRAVVNFGFTGRRHEVLRFLGQVRPKRLLAKLDLNKLGTLTKKDSVPVASLEYIGEQPVVALGTTSKTFIAEGLASHNCAPAGMHDDTVNALALARERWISRGRAFASAVTGARPQFVVRGAAPANQRNLVR